MGVFGHLTSVCIISVFDDLSLINDPFFSIFFYL